MIYKKLEDYFEESEDTRLAKYPTVTERQLGETMCAMANTDGGVILIGVDPNGTVESTSYTAVENAWNRAKDDIPREIGTGTSITQVNFHSGKHEGKQIVLLNVPKLSPLKYKGKLYVRDGSKNVVTA